MDYLRNSSSFSMAHLDHNLLLLFGLMASAIAHWDGQALVTPTGCGNLHCHILSHLPREAGCCVIPKHRDHAMSEFVRTLTENCGSNMDTLDTCVSKMILQNLGNACLCIKPEELSELLKVKMRDSVKPAMSENELQPMKQAYPNTPSRGDQQMDFDVNPENTEQIRCTDQRLQGPLCSQWAENTLTAGNTRCRSDHFCDSHGYGYRWCYVDFSNNWEYCCSGPCDFHGKDYRWCQSINRWEYCGLYPEGTGLKNVRGMTCNEDHMCGKHASYPYSYWCKHDTNGNWDYCCAPGKKCDGSCIIADRENVKRNCQP